MIETDIIWHNAIVSQGNMRMQEKSKQLRRLEIPYELSGLCFHGLGLRYNGRGNRMWGGEGVYKFEGIKG